MKLKCDTHNRRVVACNNGFIHRTGDGSKCDSPTAHIESTLVINEKTLKFIRNSK